MAVSEQVIMCLTFLVVTMVTCSDPDTEREETRYMSLMSRVHALPVGKPHRKYLSRHDESSSVSAPRVKGHPPKRKNLKTEKLLKKLGKDYNPHFMSIAQPQSLGQEPEVQNKYTLDPTLLGDLRNLNLSDFIESNKDDLVRKPDILKVMEKWLLERASCPVHYVWDDLGVYFWPRYVRRGSCGTGGGTGGGTRRSCSWPPGMHCVPAESRTIHLLRWTCRRRRPAKNNNNDVIIAGRPEVSDDALNKGNRKRHPRDVSRGRGRRRRGSRLAIELPQSRWRKNNRKSEVSDNKVKKKQRSSKRCKWTRVPYPVTDECFCSC